MAGYEATAAQAIEILAAEEPFHEDGHDRGAEEPPAEAPPAAGRRGPRPAVAWPAPAPAPWGARPALPREVAARLKSARELARRRLDERRAPLPTGVAALDRPLGGGLPRGELVELVGRRSGGRFSAVLAAVAAATAAGEAAALVNLGDGLEPAAAAALGADLERLLWLRPRTLREALAAAEAALHGGFHLVVVELGPPPLPGARALRATGPEAAWTRLARAARAHGSALLVASPHRLTGSAAAAVLAAAGRAVWAGAAGAGIAVRGAPPLLAGLAARVRAARPLRGVGGAAGSGDEALPLAAAESVPGAAGEPESGSAPAVSPRWAGMDAARAAAAPVPFRRIADRAIAILPAGGPRIATATAPLAAAG